MICLKDCTKCGEQEDCSLDGDIDLKYLILPEIEQYGTGSTDLSSFPRS